MPRLDQPSASPLTTPGVSSRPAAAPVTLDLFGEPTAPEGVRPFWQTTDEATVRLYRGHVLDVLAGLPPRSVHCVVTSPPYWALRSYLGDGHDQKHLELGSEKVPDCGQLMEVQPGLFRKGNCAERDWATGCYVCRMVLVCRELRRVLRDDGTFWLNLGDTWGSGGGNLSGIPWRVALALQADGWVLRQDVIWCKPSPMPESIRNRCTKAHEYVFILAKRMGYYYDAEAIKTDAEPAFRVMGTDTNRKTLLRHYAAGGRGSGNQVPGGTMSSGNLANRRSVWTVSTQGYPGAHFAAFPPKLIEPMIKAGTSEKGCCADCGAPWVRIVEETKLRRDRPNEYTKRQPDEEGIGNTCANDVAGVETRTVGWRPSCECHGKLVKRRGTRLGYGDYNMTDNPDETGMSKSLSARAGCARELREFPTTVTNYVSDIPLDEHPIEPCVVLDPFVGSGTTLAVCIGLGRHSVGIDLSETYLRVNAIPRVEGVLMDRPALAWLIPGR